MKFVVQLLLALCLMGVAGSPAKAAGEKADPAVMGDVLSLLEQLGYLPGVALETMDSDTERALTLFNKAENPPELSGIQNNYVDNLTKFRDALRASVARKKRLAEQATVLLQTPHGDSLTKLIVDPEAKRAISTDETSIKGWDASTGRQLWSINVPQIVLANFDRIAISQDAKYAFSFGRAIRVYDTDTGVVLRSFWNEGAEEVAALAPRPGTSELVVGEYGDDEVVIYDWKSGKRIAELGAHSNGTWQDGKVKRWIVQHAIKAIAVSPDGHYAVSVANDFGIRVWDLEQRRLLQFHPGPPGVTFEDPIFVNDGHTVVVKSASNSLNTSHEDSVFIFDSQRGLIGSKKFKDSVYISPAAEPASFFAHGELNGVDGLHLFDAEGQLKKTIDAKSLYDLVAGPSNIAFDIDNGRLVAHRLDGTELWSVPQTEVGFRALVTGKESAGQALLGQGGEVLRFDDASGSIAKTAQLRNAEGDSECCAEPAFAAADGRLFGFTLADDGPQIVAYSNAGKFVCQMPENLSRLESLREMDSIDYAPAQDIVAQWVGENVVLYSGRDCHELRRFKVTYATSTRPKLTPNLGKLFQTLPVGMRFSADGKTLFAWRAEDAVQAFDPQTGKRIAVYRLSYDNGDPSPEAAKVMADARKKRLLPLAWDVKPVPNSSKFAVITGGTYYEGNAHFGMVYVFEEGNPRWIAGYQLVWTPDQFALGSGGSRLLAKLGVQGLQSFDLLGGAHVGGLGSEPGEIKDAAYSPDGRHAYVLAGDGALRIYDAQSGNLLVTTVGVSDGTWISITPEGFFASSPGGETLVRLKRGAEMYDIEQVYQALYRPDLVREKLAGDPDGKVKEAAAQLDLDKVLASGNAPKVSILSPQDGASQDADKVAAEAEIADSGGGIGKVEWRVNGVTVGVEDQSQAPAGTPIRLTRDLALGVGGNVIEVVAYNRANLVASLPSSVKVQGKAPEGGAKPRLMVLAAGINDYADPKLKLNFAVPDAQSLAEALTKAGDGFYDSVEVTLLRDGEVTRDGLNAAFAALAAKVKPNDVFVFYVAGHGKTIDGRYYFGPQDIQVTDLASIAAQGIAQDEWQKWFASIPAQNSLLLFDTCESGSLTTDTPGSRALEQQAASGRLAQATGRTILTASSSQQLALEGIEGHGLFTYDLLDAFGRADSDGDGMLEVAELAAFVYAQVSMFTDNKQVPQLRMSGPDYALVKQTPILGESQPKLAIPAAATHVVANATEFQIEPQAGARQIHRLEAQTPVALVHSEQGWVLIAKEGRLLGYVPQADLAPIQ